MTTVADITIVGAGPYGLSIGAHLAHIGGLDVRIIGQTMHAWRHHMPRGMQLKSAGFASNLVDLQQRFNLRAFCEEQGRHYDDFAMPVPVELFAAYGVAFQQRFLPCLEDRQLVGLHRCDQGFALLLADGESILSRQVVLAVGQDAFAHLPEILAHMPPTLVSHGNRHADLTPFRDRDVAVIGSGASAVDLAVLLHEAGARVQQVMRRAQPEFSGLWRRPTDSWWARLRRPLSGIGPGWRSRLCTDLPGGFRFLPDELRLRIVTRHLGPSSGWFMKERAGALRVLGRQEIRQAHTGGGRARLQLHGPQGRTDLQVDHVIAATGYRIDLSRLPFLDADLLEQIRLIGPYPRLNGRFESSVPGLFFAGPVTAGSFGPMMRFVVGAGYTAKCLTAHFSRRVRATRPRQAAPVG